MTRRTLAVPALLLGAAVTLSACGSDLPEAPSLPDAGDLASEVIPSELEAVGAAVDTSLEQVTDFTVDGSKLILNVTETAASAAGQAVCDLATRLLSAFDLPTDFQLLAVFTDGEQVCGNAN